MIGKIIKNDKGATAVLMTLLIMTAILSSALIASNILNNNILVNRVQIDATKSFFAAEAGAERMLWETRRDSFNYLPGGVSNCNNGVKKYIKYNDSGCKDSAVYYTLGNDAKFNLEYDLTNGTTTITSIGGFNNTARQVKIRY